MAIEKIGSEALTSGFKVFSPGGAVQKDFTGAATRPYSPATQDVAAGLTQQSWDTTLQVLSTGNDIFCSSLADAEMSYANKGLSIPDSVGIRITAGGQNAVHTFPLLNPVGGKTRNGTASLLGHEKAQSQKYVRAYYNEYKDGLAVTEYGVAYNYENAFGMYQSATSQLTKYWEETFGRMKRQAIVEWFNEELLENNPAITTGTLAHLNPNWFIPGNSFVAGKTDDNGVPIYSNVLATFADRIGESVLTGLQSVTGLTTLAFFDKISLYATEYLINSLDDGTKILTVPMPVWYSLTSLTTDGGFGKFYTDVTAYPQGTDVYPGEMGRYRDLRIVPDERWVGAVVTAETAPGDDDASIAFEYKMPANEDSRSKAGWITGGTATCQLGMLLGKGAYIERKEKDLHFKYDMQNYDQNKGIGTFIETGFNLNVGRTDAGGFYPTIADNRGSAIVVFPGVRL